MSALLPPRPPREPRPSLSSAEALAGQLCAAMTRVGEVEAQNDLLRLKLKLSLRNIDLMKEQLRREAGGNVGREEIKVTVSVPQSVPTEKEKEKGEKNDTASWLQQIDEMPSPIFPSSPLTPAGYLQGDSVISTPAMAMSEWKRDKDRETERDDSIERHIVSDRERETQSMHSDDEDEGKYSDARQEQSFLSSSTPPHSPHNALSHTLTMAPQTPERSIREGESQFFTPGDPSVIPQLKQQLEEYHTALENLKWGFQKREEKLHDKLENYRHALYALHLSHDKMRNRLKEICQSMVLQMERTEDYVQRRSGQAELMKGRERDVFSLLTELRDLERHQNALTDIFARRAENEIERERLLHGREGDTERDKERDKEIEAALEASLAALDDENDEMLTETERDSERHAAREEETQTEKNEMDDEMRRRERHAELALRVALEKKLLCAQESDTLLVAASQEIHRTLMERLRCVRDEERETENALDAQREKRQDAERALESLLQQQQAALSAPQTHTEPTVDPRDASYDGPLRAEFERFQREIDEQFHAALASSEEQQREEEREKEKKKRDRERRRSSGGVVLAADVMAQREEEDRERERKHALMPLRREESDLDLTVDLELERDAQRERDALLQREREENASQWRREREQWILRDHEREKTRQRQEEETIAVLTALEEELSRRQHLLKERESQIQNLVKNQETLRARLRQETNENLRIQFQNEQEVKKKNALHTENQALVREIALYKSRIFTMLSGSDGNVHCLPDLAFSFQGSDRANHTLVSSSPAQAMYIVEKLVENNNEQLSRIEDLQKESGVHRESVLALRDQNELLSRDLSRVEAENGKLKRLLAHASRAVRQSEQDHIVLERQVDLLDKRMESLTVENRRLLDERSQLSFSQSPAQRVQSPTRTINKYGK